LGKNGVHLTDQGWFNFFNTLAKAVLGLRNGSLGCPPKSALAWLVFSMRQYFCMRQYFVCANVFVDAKVFVCANVFGDAKVFVCANVFVDAKVFDEPMFLYILPWRLYFCVFYLRFYLVCAYNLLAQVF
jgi:hypothetical protein